MCASDDRRRLGREQAHTFASASGSCGASCRSGSGASGAGPSRKKRSRSDDEPLREPGRRLLHPPVLGQPPRQLLGRLLGLELGELGVLPLEQPARLQLQQRGHQDEELPAGVEVERVPLGEPLEEAQDDPGDIDVRKVELLLEDERQKQVERALESVEIQVELSHDNHGLEPSGPSGRGSSGWPSSARRARSCGRAGDPAALGPDELPPDEERDREHEQHDRDVRVQPQTVVLVRRIDAKQLLEEPPEAVVGNVEREKRRPPDPEVLVDEQQIATPITS